MNSKKICLITAISFAFVNLLAFCIFYIPNYVLMLNVEWVEYTRVFLNKFFEYLLPVVAATVLFIGYTRDGLKKTFIRAIYFSLPRIVYLFPYYYLYYILNWNDSIESISLSALVTLFGVALFYGQIILLFWIIRVFARLPIIRELKIALPINQQKAPPKEILAELRSSADKRVCSSLSEKSIFNFSCPASLGIFAASFASFCINLVREIIGTVDYLIEYAGDYYLEEIFYITACYLFLLVELLASHAICCLIRNLFNVEKRSDL